MLQTIHPSRLHQRQRHPINRIQRPVAAILLQERRLQPAERRPVTSGPCGVAVGATVGVGTGVAVPALVAVATTVGVRAPAPPSRRRPPPRAPPSPATAPPAAPRTQCRSAPGVTPPGTAPTNHEPHPAPSATDRPCTAPISLPLSTRPRSIAAPASVTKPSCHLPPPSHPCASTRPMLSLPCREHLFQPPTPTPLTTLHPHSPPSPSTVPHLFRFFRLHQIPHSP